MTSPVRIVVSAIAELDRRHGIRDDGVRLLRLDAVDARRVIVTAPGLSAGDVAEAIDRRDGGSELRQAGASPARSLPSACLPLAVCASVTPV